MKKLTFLFIGFLAFNLAFGSSNEVITGNLGMRGIPCFSEACLTADVVEVTNDTASFILKKDGQYLGDARQLGDYGYNSIISLYGKISKGQEYNGNEFYQLDITTILKDVPAEHFQATCIHQEVAARDISISLKNDSIIIEESKYNQCAPAYALRVSDIVNDTIYITFADTAREETTCTCMFDVRISAAKSTSETVKVYYNGIVYDPVTSGIGQHNTQDIQIFPNPTDGRIEIKGLENYENLSYEVYDSKGQVIQQGNFKNRIDLSGKKGIYFLAIKQNQNIIAQEKIIVK